jgi:putative holliday junction resolvase
VPLVSKLALDVGEVRVGVAVSDPSATLARPLTVLPRRDIDGDGARLRNMIQELDVDEVVVGLPKTMRGEEGPMALAIRAVVEHLREVLAVPVAVFDERLSSVTARRVMAGRRRVTPGDRGAVDQVAAAIILQNYLDRQLMHGGAGHD